MPQIPLNLDDMSRQQTALAVKLSALMNKTITGHSISQASLVNDVNRVLNLGLDVHYRQVTVAMQEDGGRIKAAGKMGYVDFLNWVGKKLAEGWEIHSCYEAGASGYWLHRELVKLGVKNLVVVPKAMGQGGKKQKTDKRDAGELCDCLDRYLRGQDKALSVVRVPTEDQEQKRALIRFHRQIMADRGRCEARGKGLLCAQGIQVHGRWWQVKAWLEVQSDPRLKDWMKEQLSGWRNKILSTDEEQDGLRERIAALAPAILPKGVGAYSAAVLHYEMRGFERFSNRRQVGSMTGLCPGIHQSDGRGKEGSINRCGIGIVRWTLVEMVWRLRIWQPQYPPVRRLASGLVKGKRARKRLVVQAARRLAIDLWRLSTGQTTPEKLGLIMHRAK
jgi:transposase